MKLSHLKVHNFRSVADVDMAVPEFLVLLGPNNHGKSNLLAAIEFGLSTSDKPQPDDFFALRPGDDSSLWVEMSFASLTERERATFQKYLRQDGTICLRKTARLQASCAVDIVYNGYVEEPDLWWLKGSAFERLSTRERVEAEAQQVPELQELLGIAGRIARAHITALQERYIAAHRRDLRFTEMLEAEPFLGAKNVAGGVLPELFLVPAVRDLCDETKVKTSTAFGRLLQRAVGEMTARDPRFLDVRERLGTLIRDLNARPEGQGGETSELARLETVLSEELSSWGVAVSIEVSPPELEKVFELGTQLQLDDGLKTPAERKGHGLQRAVLFALLRAWARALRTPAASAIRPREASESTFFAVEEPELFLHPQAQRQLLESLGKIAEALEHQVFICTHSTHFIDLAHYWRIAIVSKASPAEGTKVRQCTADLFAGDDAADRKRRFHMAAWVNPDRGEMLFARMTVLVEGETEKAILPFLAAKIGCLDPSVSVVDCGSKHNLPLYIAILNAFGIPYCVVHDEDPLTNPIPDGWSAERRAAERRTFEMNRKIAEAVDGRLGVIEMFSPDIEGVSGISHSQSDRKGKVIAALDHFDAVAAGDLPDRLKQAVTTAYGMHRGADA